MKSDQFLLLVAILAVIVSLLAAGMTYFTVANLITTISGYAASNIGQANLTVESTAQVNFTTNYINWGTGRVLSGSSASLTTLENGNVSTNANWTLKTAGGFRIENIGNVNVSLDLLAGKTAATFLGGSSPQYQWNVSVVEQGSCLNSTTSGTSALPLFTWQNVNTTSPGTRFCTYFQFLDTNDTIRIDINLTVPYDSITGTLTDVLTATVVQI